MAPARAATAPTSPALTKLLAAPFDLSVAPVGVAPPDEWLEVAAPDGLLPAGGEGLPAVGPVAGGVGMGADDAPSIWAWTVELNWPLIPDKLQDDL